MSATLVRAARALAHEAVLREVHAALGDRDISPLLIKGPVTARLLFDDPDERSHADLDLLVPPAAFSTASETLTELGFRNRLAGVRDSEMPAHAHTFVRAGSAPGLVDLHRTLPLVKDGEALYAALSRTAQTMVLGGIAIDVPSAAGSALLVALHAAQHGPARQRGLEDLRRAVARLSVSTWREAAALARELDAAGGFALGLGMLEPGRALARGLRADARPGSEVRLRARSARGGTIQLNALLQTRDLRAAIVLLRDAAVPSPAYMRVCHPEAADRRLGLIRTYLRRWMRAPRAAGQLAQVRVLESADRVAAAAHPIGALNRAAKLSGCMRGLAWSARATRKAHRQLRIGGLSAVELPRAPSAAPGVPRGVRAGVRLSRATCLERCLVLRAWHAAQGRERRLVIGVRGSGETFGAHAWLEGDPPHGTRQFKQLLTWPDQ